MERALWFYILIHKVLQQPWRHFTSLKLCKCSQMPHSSPRVAPTLNTTKINHHWFHHLQTLYTHTLNYATSLAVALRGSSLFLSPFLIPLTNTRNKKIISWIHPVCHFVQEQKEKLIY